MDQKRAAELISDNLKNIFAFTLSRLYDKSEADDLTNDIVYEVLKSAHRLKDEKAFFGFMWRIAENTFKRYLRKKKDVTMEFDDAYMGAYWFTPEDNCIRKEEFHILRRELSLLSKQYRESTVAYYIYGKSCQEIASDLGISVDMVKYYLFKTRKILKEGIGMVREFGEKSYNPGVFRMNYWGNSGSACYWELFKRKLPGNILLAAYDLPMTLQELSVELGVAMVYLEEEIDLLLEHEIIKKMGDKYQTNIIIFRDVYEKDLDKKVKSIYEDLAEQVNLQISELLPKFRSLDFKGNDYSDNRIKWTFTNLVLYFALENADSITQKCYGGYPLLTNGKYGFIYGYDNDYLNCHFNGIYGYNANKEQTAYFTVINYCAIEKCQAMKTISSDRAIEAITDAILERMADDNNDMIIQYINEGYILSDNGRLNAKFPVFTSACMNQIKELLRPLSEEVKKCMIQICNIAGKLLRNYVPKALGDKCEQLAMIQYQMTVMAWVIETMMDKKYLILPDKKENLCMVGVRK